MGPGTVVLVAALSMGAQRAGMTSKPVVFVLEFISEPTDCGMVKPVCNPERR
jgi:hypothetical protein